MVFNLFIFVIILRFYTYLTIWQIYKWQNCAMLQFETII